MPLIPIHPPCAHVQVDDNPLPWLPEPAWQAVASLGELEEFGKFSSDLVEAGPRFREWFNHITPETEKLPLDWYAVRVGRSYLVLCCIDRACVLSTT